MEDLEAEIVNLQQLMKVHFNVDMMAMDRIEEENGNEQSLSGRAGEMPFEKRVEPTGEIRDVSVKLGMNAIFRKTRYDCLLAAI